MAQYSFLDDYSEGCHPAILEALGSSNMTQQTAYGNDEYCAQARALIRSQLNASDAPIYFVASGTMANILITAASLKSYEAVIAAHTGHIAVHETGAIEAAGHKIILVQSSDGKLTPQAIEAAVASNTHYPHMAKPRMVYITNATETGTVYTKTELQDLSAVCKQLDLLLMLDGARLSVALTAPTNDMTLADIHELVDVFWIGGTKAGALLGEAIVIPNATLAKDFAFHIKQRGGLLAKGRILGIQFKTLFTDNLFYTLSEHSHAMAQKLSSAIVACGYKLATPTEGNQVFLELPNALIEHLQTHYKFYVWQKLDNEHSVTRMVTSWATVDTQVDALIADITQFKEST